MFAVLGLLTAAGLYYFVEVESPRNKMLLEKENQENTRLLENMIGFKSHSLLTFVTDYTFWDDMLLFTETGDTSWASENISVSLKTYDSDVAWVFNRELELIYFVSGAGTGFTDTNAITKEIIGFTTSNSRFLNFFVKTNAGIIEVRGASIHPTSDVDRVTEPGGYFVVGRLWSKKLLEEIEVLTASKLELVEPAVTIEYDLSEIEEFTSKGYHRLYSWDNKPVAVLTSAKKIQILEVMHSKSENQFVIMLVFIAAVLGFTGISLYYLVNLPLKKISGALRTGEAKHITDLIGKKDEFGNMAVLVNDFFTQREKLLNEIRERTEAEIKIRLSEDDLRNSLKEKEVLIKEVHHRVKNNLQVIISLIKLQSDSISDTATVQHLTTILNRIRSIAYVHELLYRSHDLSRIDFESYLNKIVQSLRSMYSDESTRIRIEIESKNVFLTVDKAVPCAIIINELISNSMKHAFKGRVKGIINIRMNGNNGNYELSICDDGIGLGTGLINNDTKTLGLYLVSSLAEQLDAELNISNKVGLSYELKFKAEQ
jgi:two-component sensor histidine kinase